MSNAIIGALRVVLGADTAQLDKGLKDAQGSLSRFGSMVKTAGIAAVGALAGAIGGVGYAVKGVIDEADKLGKMAQSIGVPVQELSKLNYAAKLSDVSLESLSTSMVKLARNISEVAAGNTTGDAAEALRRLGISARDASGQVKSSDTVLAQIADRFSEYRDGANKTALAVALFGRSGAAMIPMLNGGSAALREAGDQAERFGRVITPEMARNAENFNDNITKLGEAGRGLSTVLAGELARPLAQISGVMVTAAENASTLKSSTAGLETVMKVVATSVIGLNHMLTQTVTIYGTLIETALKLKGLDLSGALDAVKTGLANVRDTAFDAAQNLKLIWTTPEAGSFDAILLDIDMLVPSLNRANEALRAWLETKKLDAPGLNAGASAKLAAEGLSLWNQQQREAQSLLTGAQTPFESYRAKLAEISQAQWQNGWSAETTAKLQDAAARKAGLAWDQQAVSMAGSFKQIGDAFAGESKSMAAVAKAMGIVQATIAMIQAGAEALKLGFPQGLAASATMLAQGASLVAAIKATKVPSAGGFATGGSFRVPGGMGGGDKVHAMFEPGEQVDVWRPGEGNRDPRGGGGGAPTEVAINMHKRTIFRRDEVEGLLESINELLGDNFKLRGGG